MALRLTVIAALLLAQPARAEDAPPPGVHPGWLAFTAGLVAGGAGALMLWQARVQYDLLTNPALPPLGADGGAAAAGTGRLYQSAGLVAVGVGAAGVVAGIVWLLLPRAPVAEVRLVPAFTPDGAGLTLVGTFP